MDKSWKLSHKISFFAMLIAAVVIIVTSLISVLSQNKLAREHATQGIQLLAKVTAYNVASATMFEDEEAANMVLGALELEPMVRSARLLNADQTQLAQFSREADTHQTTSQQLTIPVTWKGNTLGTLILEVDLSDLNHKLYREITISLLLAMVAVIAAGLLVQWMSHRLTKPLRSLSSVAQNISLKGEYNLRAPAARDRDEVGLLTENFNEMLDLIEKQDSYLREQQETLLASEKRLKLATGSAGLGIWDFDVSREVLLWDDRMYELFGVEHGNQENCMQTFIASLHPNDKETVLKDYNAALQGEREFDTLFRIICPNGALKHIKGNAVVLRDSQGQPIRMLGINADITEQELNLVKLKETSELKERLAQVSKMESLGQLTAGIAHDFNNMLGAIMGFSELSQLKVSHGDYKAISHYQERILDAGKRAKELIAQMLTFSRSQPQLEGADAPVVSINSVVKDVMSLLRPIIPATIELNCIVPKEVLHARIQTLHLQQILLNLGVNAKDAAGEYGKINIVMSKVNLENEVCNSCNNLFSGEYVQIAVIDDGPGIPESVFDNVFDPFFTTKDIGKGTGMGLSVVHGLVHSCNGHIQVVSNQETGTEFKVLLPLTASEENTLPEQEEHSVEDLKDIRIMVVDDEPELGALLKDLFSEYGAKVDVFTEPEKALAALLQSKASYDILITDETMPAMSGMKLSEKVLEVIPSFPIILCTGYSEHANPESAAKLGISGFFYKPVNMRELRQKAHDLVRANRFVG